ncbi:S8 family peptidase [Halobacteriovorax sp.]|uniref:S8 family peptidase n=1 Tax=Halobacteriovorax sp. TaxID=2020862 RepID=UPI0035657DC7
MKLLLILSYLFSLNSLANDPLSKMQWGIENSGQPVFRSTGELTRELVRGIDGEDVNIPASFTAPKEKVIVAVIDSGVDIYHPDLKDNIWLNPKCSSMTEEEMANEDCRGWNFLDGNADVVDDIGHGTHVAGIIAAVENNGIGIKGVASKNVQIMPLKILNSKVKSFVYEKKVITNIIADAIAYAVSNGASVINLSLGWPELIHTRKVRYAIDTAIKRNVAIIVAAGNNNKKLPVYPCSYDEVICVGAMDNQGSIPEFSNFGGKVDLIAPGEGILSTYPRNLESRTLRIPGYEIKKGSSQAAPFVSALVALFKSQNKNMSFDEIKYRLFKGSNQSNTNKKVKFGKVDFQKALESNVAAGFPLFKFKSLTDITIEEDGGFKFNIPVRSLMTSIPKLAFSLSLKDAVNGKTVFSKEYSYENVSDSKETLILVEDKIKDFKTSSHLILNIEWEDKSFEHEIAIVRDMLKVSGKVTQKLKFKDSEVLVNSNGRLSTRLRKVISNKYHSESIDYYVQRKSEQVDKTLIEVSKVKLTGSSNVKIEFDEVGKIISVIKNDFNNDGREDYMVYSLSKEQKHLVLTFANSDGSPLYSDKSQWFLEISTFEGLPLANGEIRFEYLNVAFDGFGKVKVPAYMKDWLMPEQDNSRDILDRIPDEVSSNKPYFLKPSLKDGRVDLEIRTLSSLATLEVFKKKFSIMGRDVLTFDHLLEQDKYSTSLEAILVSGSEFSKRYFHINYSSLNDYSIEEIFFYGLSLDSNRTIVSRFSGDQYNASFALNSRQDLRTVFWDFSGEREVHNFKTDSWGDIIIDIFDFSKSYDDNLVLLESRYFIHAIGSSGNSQKLPINRESSFPGVSFSETFKKVDITLKDSKARGILVDSTLIYGSRIYAMVYSEGEFSAPIYASYSLPKNCKYLDINEFEEGTHIVLACQDKFLRATLELVPLKERVE